MSKFRYSGISPDVYQEKKKEAPPRRQTKVYAYMRQEGDMFAIKCSYDDTFLKEFKALVPPSDRRWDGAKYQWLFSPRYAHKVAALVARTHQIQVDIPEEKQYIEVEEERQAQRLQYLGMARKRVGETEPIAYGMDRAEAWAYEIPLSVLKAFFSVSDAPASQQTYYEVLGIPPNTPTDQMRKAYRRAARTWHPDVCKEDNAHDMFIRVQKAYEVLSDPLQRKKYDVCLQFAAKVPVTSYKKRGEQEVVHSSYGWVPPLRCGILTVRGVVRRGTFRVTKILQWDDITNSFGETLVTTWDRERDGEGKGGPVERWVR